MIRIWNERSQAIGGVGAQAVIKTLATVMETGDKIIHAEQGESEFKDHEGVFVDERNQYKAAKKVIKYHGRHE